MWLNINAQEQIFYEPENLHSLVGAVACDPLNALGLGRIQTMTAYGKTWTFGYEAIGGSLSNPNHAYFLTRVIQPDQTSWFYDYYRQEQNSNPLFPEDQAGPGSYSIKSYKLPTGATTTYSYQNVFFNQVGQWPHPGCITNCSDTAIKLVRPKKFK
ncbi:hypothetical protein [Reinekea sp.]|uniref:hypothetical protein n=1 Tax=Reinekea sp. TaxID=1970455 RepID=UPI002A7F07B1|nr:hypothetical protein [Reinekea sp.]